MSARRPPPLPRTPRAAPAVAAPAALLAALCLGLGGCGNKGDLYLPGPDARAPIEPALPALEDAVAVPPGEPAVDAAAPEGTRRGEGRRTPGGSEAGRGGGS